jgi:hypothetical protein
MTREEMIERLLDVEANYYSSGGYEWEAIERLLRSGFRGFDNMSDAELAAEVAEEGIEVGDDEVAE